jgi:hypothetical protein
LAHRQLGRGELALVLLVAAERRAFLLDRRLYRLSITAADIGTWRNLSQARSSCPCAW